MAAYYLAPDPCNSTFLIPGSNTPGNGVQVFTYAAGTQTKVSVAKDVNGSALHTNPIVLDSGGNLPSASSIYAPVGTAIDVVYAPANDTDPPASAYRTIASIQTATDASDITYTPAASTAVATTVQTKLREFVSVKDFGATGDGTTDDTAAIQAAMNYATGNTKAVCVPDGNYKISSAITIPQNANGFSFVGASLKGTVFTQSTNNIAHFSWPGGNNSNFTFGNFTLAYSSAQSAANTGARALDFTVTADATFAGYGIYNSTFLPIRVVDGCRGLYAGNTSDGDTFTTTTWGLEFGLLVFEGMSGGCIRFRGASPNNRFVGPIYVVAPVTGTEELVYFQNQDCLYVGGYEVNNNLSTNRIALRLDQCRGVIDCFRQEGGSYSVASSSLISHANSWITFGEIRLLTTTIAVGALNKFFIFVNTSSTGHISVDTLAIESTTLTSGIPLILDTGGVSNRLTLRHAPILDVFNLSDVGSSTASDGLYVDAWNLQIVSADNGDNSTTVTVSSPMVQRFNTTLTSSRTITIPNEFGSSGPSDLFDGKKFIVLRDASTSGTFTLSIVGNGSIYVIGNDAKERVELTYKRLSWIVTDIVTLP